MLAEPLQVEEDEGGEITFTPQGLRSVDIDSVVAEQPRLCYLFENLRDL